jgi:hypothetical protein
MLWVHTLLNEISTREITSNSDWDKSMCDSNNSGSEAQFERASWSDCYRMPQLETANDPKLFRLYDFTGKTLHSCWGTCIYC